MTPVRLEPVTPRSRVKHSTTELPNSGTSSKKRYRYFVPTTHPGTCEIAPKDKNVQRWGSVAFIKKIKVLSDRWIIIPMLFRVGIVSVCVCPKMLIEIKIVST